MEVEPKIDIVTIPLSILQVFQTWHCQGGTLGWSSTVKLHFLQHRVSELMHSCTSDPSPSPLHLVVVKVPHRQIQCSSYYHQLLISSSMLAWCDADELPMVHPSPWDSVLWCMILISEGVTIFTLHALFPILVSTSTGCWAIFVHCYLFIPFNYYLLLTQAQQCTVCLLMHSTLTYAQPSCTVYKDIMDTHFQ